MMPSTVQRYQERKARVRVLSEQGMDVPAIASQMDRSEVWVRKKLGIKRQRGSKSIPIDITSGRGKTILIMSRAGCTLKQMGEAIGTTRERARQVQARIAKNHGEGVLKPPEELLSLYSVAKQLQRGYYILLGIIKAGKIPHRVLPKGIFLSQDEVEVLKVFFGRGQERKCEVCGKSFDWIRKRGKRLSVCSKPECRIKYRTARHKRNVELGPNSLKDWRSHLVEELEKPENKIPSDEQWLILGEARKMSGLSNMQVSYLGSLIATAEHPTKKWRGKPIILYSATHVRVAGEVYREWINNGQKS